MRELKREIEQFNNKYVGNYEIEISFSELLEISEEIELLYEITGNYDQCLFKKFGYDYDKDKIVIALSKALINLYE